MVKHQKVEGHMETEGIVVAIKKLILPELEAIKGIQAKMDVKLDAVRGNADFRSSSASG